MKKQYAKNVGTVERKRESILPQNRGITIISLVVTIILLLILAGISIQAITNTGLFETAGRAKKEAKRAQVVEWLNLKLVEKQSENTKGTDEDIIKATQESVKTNISELETIGKDIVVEDTKTEEDGEKADIYFYVQVDKDVYKVDIKGAKFIGEAGKFPPIIKIESITSTTNSITVKVSTKRNEGGKIEYYIKAEGEKDYKKIKEEKTKENADNLEYTYTGLEQNKKYSIKIEAIAENKQKVEVIKEEIQVGSVTISKENITSSVKSWNGTTATVEFKTNTGYYIQTKVGSGNWSANPATTGTATANTKTGTIVYARLTDSTGQYNNGDVASITPVLTYTIAFNSNGGSGSMGSLTSRIYGTLYTLTANSFSKSGSHFKGWNTKADGTGTTYSNGASVSNLTTTNGATVTLYAIWEKHDFSDDTGICTICGSDERLIGQGNITLNNNWSFSSILPDETGLFNYKDVMPTLNVSYTANKVDHSQGGNIGMITYNKAIDLTKVDKIIMNFWFGTNHPNATNYTTLGISKSNASNDYTSFEKSVATSNHGTTYRDDRLILDVNDFTGNYYLKVTVKHELNDEIAFTSSTGIKNIYVIYK